jgi:hypothetical protein
VSVDESLKVSAAFLAASVLGDLKDARFTLILIALSYRPSEVSYFRRNWP